MAFCCADTVESISKPCVGSAGDRLNRVYHDLGKPYIYLKIVAVVELVHGQPIYAYEHCAMEGDTTCPMLRYHGIIMPQRTSKKSKPRDISLLHQYLSKIPPTKRPPTRSPLANLAARRAVTPVPRS